MRLIDLPRTFGSLHQRGTVTASLSRHTDADDNDHAAVTITFGNQFSEHLFDLTVDAARELRNQLDDALDSVDEIEE